MITLTDKARHFADTALRETKKEIYGMDEVIKLCLVAMVADGHVLLEANPGFGKTTLVKTMAKVLRLPWGRIQFTPDLMPADIVGTFMPEFSSDDGRSSKSKVSGPQQTGDGQGLRLEFQPGPLFTCLLLADEINRATPKTQSAMLEAMAERQVTVLGHQRPLDSDDFVTFIDKEADGTEHKPPRQKDRPFMVLATQNPLDYEGTYELPKAQTDRFMFKILVPIPGDSDLMLILNKDAGALGSSEPRDGHIQRAQARPLKESYEQVVANLKKFKEHLYNKVRSLAVMEQHVVGLYMASNGRYDFFTEGSKAIAELANYFEFGLGPRAPRDLIKAAKAWALYGFLGSDEQKAGLDPRKVDPIPDASALAHVIVPALRHRLLLRYQWSDAFREKHPDADPERLIDFFVRDFAIACLPPQKGVAMDYAGMFKKELDSVLKAKAS